MDKKRKSKIENLLDLLYTNYYDLYIQVQSHCNRHEFTVFTYLNSILDISEAIGRHPISIIQILSSDY